MNIVIIKQFSIIIIKAALRIKMILHVKVNKKNYSRKISNKENQENEDI